MTSRTCAHAETECMNAVNTLNIAPEWLLPLATFFKHQTQLWGGHIVQAQCIDLLSCVVVIETRSLNPEKQPVLSHKVFWLELDLKDGVRIVQDTAYHIDGPGNWPLVRRESAQHRYNDLIRIVTDKTLMEHQMA